MNDFSPMYAGDSETLTFDFTNTLPAGVTIVKAVPRIAVHAGADPAPAALVVDGPTIDGTVVSMRVSPLIPGVSYWPRVQAYYTDSQYVTLPDPGEGSLRIVS